MEDIVLNWYSRHRLTIWVGIIVVATCTGFINLVAAFALLVLITLYCIEGHLAKLVEGLDSGPVQ